MKKRFAIVSLALAGLSVNANAGFFDELNKVLVTTNSVLGVVTGTPTTTSSSSSYPSAVKAPPLAQLTPAQEQQINQVVRANTTDSDLNRAILEAKPNIEGVMKLAACQTDDLDLMAGRFLSPDSMHTYSVIPYMKYKPLNHCMNVSSVGNWKILSRSRLDYHQVDEISFSIVYSSDITPESASRYTRMKREGDGQWYVTMHKW